MASVQTATGVNRTTGNLCVSGMRMNYRQALPERRHLVPAINGQIEYYPGILQEKPKHPDYALKKARLSSFTDWKSEGMDPAQLAEAGFYFTGIHDCVRCFLCGGGMKDWKADDNAWIEHAKWFPNCAYVKLRKGEEFINMCRMANIDYIANETDVQNQGAGQQVDDQMIEDLNSTAAKLVMNMGYSQDDITNAIREAHEKYGSADLRAQYILEFLFENDCICTPTGNANANVPSRQPSIPEASAGSVTSGLPTGVSHTPGSTTGVSCKPASKQHSDIFADEENEFTEEQRHLLEENHALKQQMTCKICMDKDACIVFIPCGHMVACVDCGLAIRKCAVCRSIIQGTVRAYPA